MPTFTMELWRVLDMTPAGKTEDEYLGLSDYPIFEDGYREALNTKIKRRFMYQEIGQETISQFTFALMRKMHEIMPVYNELYKSTKLEFDPLSTIDVRTVSTGQEAQTSEGSTSNETESSTDSTAKNVVSNFPQVQLSPDKDYATNGADSNSQTKNGATVSENSEAENTSSSESDSHTSGYQGIPAQLLQAYRSTIINVDLMVLSELEDLFMIVWNNSDDYTTTKGRRFY